LSKENYSLETNLEAVKIGEICPGRFSKARAAPIDLLANTGEGFNSPVLNRCQKN
jgi:hypothetical protein